MRKVARRNRKYTDRVGNSKSKGPLNGHNAKWKKNKCVLLLKTSI